MVFVCRQAGPALQLQRGHGKRELSERELRPRLRRRPATGVPRRGHAARTAGGEPHESRVGGLRSDRPGARHRLRRDRVLQQWQGAQSAGGDGHGGHARPGHHPPAQQDSRLVPTSSAGI